MLAPDWSALQLTAEQWTSRTLTVWCEFRLLGQEALSLTVYLSLVYSGVT